MSETLAALHPWLAGFRPQDRPLLRAWFAYCVSQGARRPEAVVEMVQRMVGDKLSWSVSATSIALCEATLAALAHRRAEALAYAATCSRGMTPTTAIIGEGPSALRLISRGCVAGRDLAKRLQIRLAYPEQSPVADSRQLAPFDPDLHGTLGDTQEPRNFLDGIELPHGRLHGGTS